MEKQRNNMVRTRDILRTSQKYSGLSLDTVKKCYEAILSSISESVDNGNIVVLERFCKFELRKVKEHSKRSFGGREIVVPERTAIKFKAYGNFTLYHIR